MGCFSCLWQLFKLTVLIMNLSALGTGYVKFYQLFYDIGATFEEIVNTDTFEDLLWIRYLIIQLSSTVWILLASYCLIRELCEDSYMYKRCFKPCVILTILIYCLGVIPKSILNIVYRGFDHLTLDEWFNRLTDVLDGLLGGLAVLGFQIILFLKVIVRVFRSAGVCLGSTQLPDTQTTDNDADTNETSGCCICICCKEQTLNKPSNGDTTDIQDTKTLPTSASKPRALYNKGSDAVKMTRVKIKTIQESVDTQKQAVSNRINSEIDKKKKGLKTAALTKGQALKHNFTKTKTVLCKNCEKHEKSQNGIDDRITEQNEKENPVQDTHKDAEEDVKQTKGECAYCGLKLAQTNEDLEPNNFEARDKELEANNKDLRANDYVLKANDSELKAKDKDLKANDKELGANGKDLEARDKDLEANYEELELNGKDLTVNDKDLLSNDKDLEANDKDIGANDNVLESYDNDLKANDIDFEANNTDLEANSKPKKCAGCCTSLLNDRTKCFVIISVLTNFHMFVYLAELALILCYVC